MEQEIARHLRHPLRHPHRSWWSYERCLQGTRLPASCRRSPFLRTGEGTGNPSQRANRLVASLGSATAAGRRRL